MYWRTIRIVHVHVSCADAHYQYFLLAKFGTGTYFEVAKFSLWPDLFIEETVYARTLYFNKDGTLRWTHVNREDNNVYTVGWSRILYSKEDIKIVNNFLINKGTCNE